MTLCKKMEQLQETKEGSYISFGYNYSTEPSTHCFLAIFSSISGSNDMYDNFVLPFSFLSLSFSLLLAVSDLGNPVDEDDVSVYSVGYAGANFEVQSQSAMTPHPGWSGSNFASDGPALLASHTEGNSHLILQCQGPTPRASVCNEGTSSSQALAQIDPRLSRPVHRSSTAFQGHPQPQLQQGATLAPSISNSALRRHSSPSM